MAHGATGKGNDQVRFELTFAALAPELTVIAPWRESGLDLQGPRRDDRLRRGSTRSRSRSPPRSPTRCDRNLLHISYEGGILEDPWREPYDDMFQLTVAPEKAPDEPEYVEIEFAARRCRWRSTASGSRRRR